MPLKWRFLTRYPKEIDNIKIVSTCGIVFNQLAQVITLFKIYSE